MDTVRFLNPGKTALLVIDVQQGLFGKATPIYRAEELLENINSLVARAHKRNIPVVYIQHADQQNLVRGSQDWQLHPTLKPSKKDFATHKQQPNAFDETVLHETLRGLGVTCVVIAGLVTHGCVKATCLGALQLGYHVILVQDAHSNFSPQAAAIIDKWHNKLKIKKVELKSTIEITFD